MDVITKAYLISYLNGRIESLNQTIANLNTLFTDNEIRLVEESRLRAKRSEVYYIIDEIKDGVLDES
jgi:hypothetical protein